MNFQRFGKEIVPKTSGIKKRRKKPGESTGKILLVLNKCMWGGKISVRKFVRKKY